MALEVNYSNCPECFELISDENKIEVLQDVLVETPSFDEYYDIIKYRCNKCGCEFEKKVQKRRAFSWKKGKHKVLIGGIIFAVLGLLIAWLLHPSVFRSILSAFCWIVLLLAVGIKCFFATWNKGGHKIVTICLTTSSISFVLGVLLRSFSATSSLGSVFLLSGGYVFAATLLIWLIIVACS